MGININSYCKIRCLLLKQLQAAVRDLRIVLRTAVKQEGRRRRITRCHHGLMYAFSTRRVIFTSAARGLCYSLNITMHVVFCANLFTFKGILIISHKYDVNTRHALITKSYRPEQHLLLESDRSICHFQSLLKTPCGNQGRLSSIL